MLPSPATSSRPSKPSFRKSSLSFVNPRSKSRDKDDIWAYRLSLLSTRSRITNLGVLLLVGMLFLSIMLNIRHWTWDVGGLYGGYNSGRFGRGVFRSAEETLERSKELRELEHLIIVPGHGVWLGDEPSDAFAEDSWALEHYQKEEGAASRIDAFVAHIRRGIDLANEDSKSLLVFSGGATRSNPTTEAASYFSLALSLSLLTPPPLTNPTPGPSTPILTTFLRTTTEDHALDSYQNLIFSIARFRGVTGRYPRKITVVGYKMKEARFSQLHRRAVKWSGEGERWRYVGIDIEDPAHREEAQKGEKTNGYTPYTKDLYGCHGSLLAKRRARNVHHRIHPYHASAPEMISLLEWCPDDATELFDGPLPWDST